MTIGLEQAWAARVHRVVVGAIAVVMVALPLGLAVPAEAGVDLLCVARTRAPEVGLTLVKQERVSPRTRIYTFRSKAVGPDATPNGLVRVRVVLPSRYLLKPNLTTRYPVIFYLHGTGQNATAYSTPEMEAVMGDTRAILVTPDGAAGFYSNWMGASRLPLWPAPKTPPGWETFHTRELITWIDARLRTNKKRAIMGSSMGGFGAMSYAARNPGLFRAAGSFSGAVDTEALWPAIPVVISATYNPCIWGDPVLNRQRWRAHNPTALAAKLRGTSLFVASGNGLPGKYDTPQNANPRNSVLEVAVKLMSDNFVAALRSHGIPVTTFFYGNGTHPSTGSPTRKYDYDDMARFLPQAMLALR